MTELKNSDNIFHDAPIAQRIRAPVFGTGCRGFESLWAHHFSGHCKPLFPKKHTKKRAADFRNDSNSSQPFSLLPNRKGRAGNKNG